MKITIKKSVPVITSAKKFLAEKKHKEKIVSETIEIPDKLVDKTIAVIDELLDRSWNDSEESSWTDLDFPLVPFPFFHKHRLPENVGIDDYWISYWLDTDLYGIITERTKIIGMLKETQALEIKLNPVVNISSGIFDGEKFTIHIKERSKLKSLRNEVIEKRKKTKKEKKIKQEEMPKNPWLVEITKMPPIEIRQPTGLSKQNIQKVVYLNQFGDLFREPRKKYCYSMGERSDRHKLIRFLIENKGYQDTRLISSKLNNKSIRSVQTEIGKIRKNIHKYLKIDGKDLIQAKKESGYRINPKHKIILKNE